MTLLIVEPLEPDLVNWLRARYTVRLAPELASDPRALRQVLADVRAMILPASVGLDASTLALAPHLRAVGRITAGAENIDFEACARAQVEVVRSSSGTAQAEAEFVIGALLTMLRRVPVMGPDGARTGRELGASTVGLIGLTPGARAMARLLAAFGARVVGYDPAVHGSESVWARWNIQPLPLRELLEQSDAVSVQLGFFSRYRGLFGERLLLSCKPDQVLVNIGHSGLFDAEALADALRCGRLAAVWFDSLDPAALRRGQPLAGLDNLQVTPRLASTTAESRRRCARAVVKRIDQLLNDDLGAPVDGFTPSRPGGSAGLPGEPGWR